MTDDTMKVAQDSARGGFFLIAGSALSMVVLSVSAILIARLLGADAYGQYSLVIVVPMLLYLFTDLGLTQGITKFASDFYSKKDYGRLASVVKHGLVIRVLAGILISVLTYVFGGFFASTIIQRPELGFLVELSAVSVLFQVLFVVATSVFVGLDKAEYNALTQNLQSFAKTVLQIVLILTGFGVAGALIGHVASYLVGGVIGLLLVVVLLRRNRGAGTGEKSGFAEDTRVLLRYGSPLYLSTVLIGVVPLVQSIILAFFASDADVGNFKAATNFAALMTVLSIPIQTAMLPAFSKLGAGANGKIGNFFRMANKYTAVLVVPVTLLLVVFSGPIVSIVYGVTYESAAPFLSAYCLVYFLVGFGFLTLTSFYNGLGETKVTLRISLITFVILVVLSPFLTSVYGVLGLIAAYLIANGGGQIYSSFYARRRFKITFDTPSLLKIFVVSGLSMVAPALILFYSGLSAVLCLVIGAVLFLFTYLTLMPLVRIVTPLELKQTSMVVKKTALLSWVSKPIIAYQERLLSFSFRPSKERLEEPLK